MFKSGVKPKQTNLVETLIEPIHYSKQQERSSVDGERFDGFVGELAGSRGRHMPYVRHGHQAAQQHDAVLLPLVLATDVSRHRQPVQRPIHLQ